MICSEQGLQWSLESVKSFDGVEEIAGTTFFPKGDPESEDGRNRGRNNPKHSTTTPVEITFELPPSGPRQMGHGQQENSTGRGSM
jgi:hypothetical protein